MQKILQMQWNIEKIEDKVGSRKNEPAREFLIREKKLLVRFSHKFLAISTVK